MTRWPARITTLRPSSARLSSAVALSLSSALLLSVLLSPALLAAQAPARNSVLVMVQASLGADGALRGTLRSTWTGSCAADLRARLQKTGAGERAAMLNSLASASLAGHLKPQEAIAGLDAQGGDLTVTYALDAPKFAAPGAGKSLLIGLPLLHPYDPRKIPVSLLPVSIDHDISIELPAGMVPLEFPPVFSTVTPGAGRYVLYHDVERKGGLVLKVRRELEIIGPPSAALEELLDGVSAHDSPTLSLLVAPSRPASR
jgi:hypothetical protein